MFQILQLTDRLWASSCQFVQLTLQWINFLVCVYKDLMNKNVKLQLVDWPYRGLLTIFPDANINAVVFGSLILMITAAKRFRDKKSVSRKQFSRTTYFSSNIMRFWLKKHPTGSWHTLGLYSALRACKAIALRSNLQSKLTVETIFLEIKPEIWQNIKFSYITILGN